jgi:hypothetical protein
MPKRRQYYLCHTKYEDCHAGFKKVLGESVKTITCRLEGDVTDPVASNKIHGD